MSSNIIPSRLHRVHTFESTLAYIVHENGRWNIQRFTTPPLEWQCDKWVDQTKNLIVGTGPLYILQTRETRELTSADLPPETPMQDNSMPYPVFIETRTLAVQYVPAVEQRDVTVHGEQQSNAITGGGQVRPVSASPQPAGTGADQGPGPAGDGNRAVLRVPPVP